MHAIVVGAAKGTYLEWNITREAGDNFFSAVSHSTFHCELGCQFGQITHYVSSTWLGFPGYMTVLVVCFRWAHCNMAFGCICKYNNINSLSHYTYILTVKSKKY